MLRRTDAIFAKIGLECRKVLFAVMLMTLMLPYHVTLIPQLPVLATTAIFSFLWTWNDFIGPLVYLNDSARYTVPLALRSFVDATGQSNWGQLFAMSVLALLPIFLFFLVFQRLIIEGVAHAGMKR